MFNLDFGQLMIIGIVALVVLGPERLPKVARKVGYWLGRIQRFMNTLAEDINEEMELEKLRSMQQKAQEQLMELDEKIRKESAEPISVFAEAEYKINTMSAGREAEAGEGEANGSADSAHPTQVTVEVLEEVPLSTSSGTEHTIEGTKPSNGASKPESHPIN